MIAIDVHVGTAAYAAARFNVSQVQSSGQPVMRGFDASTQSLNEVKVGGTKYPLRHPLNARFFPRILGANGAFVVDGFGQDFVGEGVSSQIAQRDWSEKVHTIIQELLAMRQFEMTKEQRATLSRFAQLIDLTVYVNNTPVRIRQAGTVHSSRPHPHVVLWENGAYERVDLERAVADFATFQVGQPFEAIVERDRISGELLRMSYAKRTKSLSFLKKEEAEDLWNSLPSSEALPVTKWSKNGAG